MDLFSRDQDYIANTYARFPLAVSGGKGSVWIGEDGREYIDLGSGIAVNVFGASDEEWVQAVSGQARLLSHTSNWYYTKPQVALACMLLEKSGMAKVFFGNSGAEANECAIKVARKYGGKRYKIISLEGSFHGRTLATLAMTGQDIFHEQYLPLPEGFTYVSPYDLAALEKAFDDPAVCALMMEIVQGEGGVEPISRAFAQRAQELCHEHDILLMVDEIQTGMGRTGALFAYMHYGLRPDVVTAAKGLGGGLPIGACLMGQKTEGVLSLSDHGSTFGGNPVCCAAALSVLGRMNQPLYDEINEKSRFMITELTGLPGVKSLSGMGLMLGIETVKPARETALQCLEKGVLVLTAKGKIRLLPPVNIPWPLLRIGMAALAESLA